MNIRLLAGVSCAVCLYAIGAWLVQSPEALAQEKKEQAK